MGCHPDLKGLLIDLLDSGVEFILVGGLAAAIQGVPATTFDVDVVHNRTPENVARILQFLAKVHARVRNRPEGQILVPDAMAFSGRGHQLLLTDKGSLDFLGAIEGGKSYEELALQRVAVRLADRQVWTLPLAVLLELKRHSSHPKDRLSALLIEQTLQARK